MSCFDSYPYLDEEKKSDPDYFQVYHPDPGQLHPDPVCSNNASKLLIQNIFVHKTNSGGTLFVCGFTNFSLLA